MFETFGGFVLFCIVASVLIIVVLYFLIKFAVKNGVIAAHKEIGVIDKARTNEPKKKNNDAGNRICSKCHKETWESSLCTHCGYNDTGSK